MRTLDVNELEAVAGGRSLRREDSLSDWLDALIGSLTVSVHGNLDRTSGGGVSDIDWNADPSSWFDVGVGRGGGGGGDGGGDKIPSPAQSRLLVSSQDDWFDRCTGRNIVLRGVTSARAMRLVAAICVREGRGTRVNNAIAVATLGVSSRWSTRHCRRALSGEAVGYFCVKNL